MKGRKWEPHREPLENSRNIKGRCIPIRFLPKFLGFPVWGSH